jgi:hypothetical protein
MVRPIDLASGDRSFFYYSLTVKQKCYKNWKAKKCSVSSLRDLVLPPDLGVAGGQQDGGEQEGRPEERLRSQQAPALWTYPGGRCYDF